MTCGGSSTALDITWRFFSLEEVNLVEGKAHPWERPWSFGFGQMRVGSLIRRELGNDALDRWYDAIGHAFFYDGVKTHVPETHALVIEKAGFDPTFVERALADDSTLAEVRAEHEDAGCDSGAHGVPTIVFESDYAVYGPVVVPAPTGDDACALGSRAPCNASRTCTSSATPRRSKTSCTSANSSARTSRHATGKPSRTRRRRSWAVSGP